VKKGQNGQLRFRVGWGQWLSDYTYVDNVADAVLLADEALARDGIGSTAAGEAFFITNGEPKPFWDFIRNVAERLGFPSAKITVPKNLVYAAAAIKEGISVLKGGDPPAEDGLTRFAIRYMCTHHYFSIEKARRLLGYKPKVSIAEGIERTCQYLEDVGMIGR
jgi:sterol-4alpha-carboxylate 3-dehydrogenase (decarboxylating)